MLGAIQLETGGDAVKILIIAAIVGAIASVISELLLTRGKAANTGVFERRRAIGASFYDLGSWAAIPIGVLAGAIAGLLLTPVKEVTTNNVTTETMALDNLLVVSAIGGLGAAGFLRALGDRFVAAMKAQGLDVALRDAITALKDLEQDAAEGGAGGRDDGGNESRAGGTGVAARARTARVAAEDRHRELVGT